MRLAGFTHSQIYDGVRDGGFPKWNKTGWPAQQWDRGAVDAWLGTWKGGKKMIEDGLILNFSRYCIKSLDLWLLCQGGIPRPLGSNRGLALLNLSMSN